MDSPTETPTELPKSGEEQAVSVILYIMLFLFLIILACGMLFVLCYGIHKYREYFYWWGTKIYDCFCFLGRNIYKLYNYLKSFTWTRNQTDLQPSLLPSPENENNDNDIASLPVAKVLL